MKRRTAGSLQRATETAKARRQKARAFYELGVFHDNNSREAEAIPNYQKAIRLGLDKKHEAMARAWLASSFFKIGKSKSALKECHRAARLAVRANLQNFISHLKRRINIET